MEEWISYIHPELLILIPVLSLAGAILKKTSFLSDRWIPLVLAGIGVGLSLLYEWTVTPPVGAQGLALLLFTACTQGILVSGTSVFCHQVYKQLQESKSDASQASEEEDTSSEDHPAS